MVLRCWVDRIAYNADVTTDTWTTEIIDSRTGAGVFTGITAWGTGVAISYHIGVTGLVYVVCMLFVLP